MILRVEKEILAGKRAVPGRRLKWYVYNLLVYTKSYNKHNEVSYRPSPTLLPLIFPYNQDSPRCWCAPQRITGFATR